VKRIDCPHCGLRDEIEFTWGGQANLVRPDPARCSDEDWRDYLFMRTNPRGLHHERWCHTYGCGMWFGVERDTVSHRIEKVHATP
jgi:sarcosine oxidase, subunit delta